MSDAEVSATVHYWKRMGELMGIHDIPADYAAFSEYFDTYERERFAFSPGGRAVADSTLDLLVSWYPAALRPVMRVMAISLMDPLVRRTLRYDTPSAAFVRAAQTILGLRQKIVRRLPSRRTPVRAVEDRRVKSYPQGWDMARVGTFPERGTPSP